MELRNLLKKCETVSEARVSLWEKHGKSRIYIEYDNRKFYIEIKNDKAIVVFNYSNNYPAKEFFTNAGLAIDECNGILTISNYSQSKVEETKLSEEKTSEPEKEIVIPSELKSLLKDMPMTTRCFNRMDPESLDNKKLLNLIKSYINLSSETILERKEYADTHKPRTISQELIFSMIYDEIIKRRI